MRALGDALSAVTAAVVGVILNLAVWFGVHVIFRETVAFHGYGLSLAIPVLTSVDIIAVLVAVAAAVAIICFKRGSLRTLLACSLAGWLFGSGWVTHYERPYRQNRCFVAW